MGACFLVVLHIKQDDKTLELNFIFIFFKQWHKYRRTILFSSHFSCFEQFVFLYYEFALVYHHYKLNSVSGGQVVGHLYFLFFYQSLTVLSQLSKLDIGGDRKHFLSNIFVKIHILTFFFWLK